MAVDVLVRGATVYDGSGSPGRQMDVAVAQGKVVAVGERAGGEAAARVLDAGGLALAPGFIDLHSHADFTLPAFPDAPNSITQGVTTEVLGHCGFSPAPVSPDPGLADQLRTYAHGLGPDLDWGWQSFGEFLDRLDEARPAVNVVPLVGHGPLRIAAMGMDDRRPSVAELAAMRAGLADALAAGAWGMSTGLVYPPGVFADRDELLEIGQELQRAEALYDSHIRDEGDGLLPAVDEALAIGERLGVRVQVSHLKATGRRNFGRVGAAIERIEGARARGVRAHCDVYPYTAGSTFLHQVLPPWVKDGGTERMLERLRAEEPRRRIRRELETGLPGWGDFREAAGAILIASVVNPQLRWAEGKRLSELAAQAASDPLDLTLDLLLRDRGATIMVAFLMDEADVRTALCYREAGIGSDQLGVTSAEARVHPRAYGTFARVLGWAARDTGLLPLEEAVRKMTGLPAAILGLADRGRVAPGAAADLVLFDPATVQDAATYEEPTRRARGVEHVLLGGDFAIDRGEPRELRRGRVLRRASRGSPAPLGAERRAVYSRARMAGPPFINLPLPRRGGDSGAGQSSGAADPLDGIPLFALVAPELRARIRKKLALRSVPDGKPLFRAGEPADALYVVQSGRFRVFVRDRYHREHVLQFVGPGEVLGEAALMADTPHVIHAEAVEPARVWRLARDDFEALLGNEQAVLRHLAGVISQRQAQANARVAVESTPEEARAERGYVTAVYSPRGGAGVTTLAVALGVALAERHPDDVVVLDLDVLFGHTASYLWLQPRGVLAQVPPNTLHQLDRRGLDYYLLPHESSLRVFPAAQRPEEGEQVSADHVRAAVGTLKRHFGHVLLDLPHGFSEVTLTGLEMANRVLVLATPELATLRDIVEVRRIFAELLGLPATKARYVLNHPHPYGGIPVADFVAATGIAWEEIAFGGDGPSQAALRGEALLNTRPGNPISKAATRLAETVSREAKELLALAGR